MNDTLKSRRVLHPLPAALLLATALAAPFANAQTTAVAGQGRHAYSVLQQRELQAIGASPEQRSQIKAILKQARDDMRLQRKTTTDLRKQLAQVLAAPSVDATAAEGVRQKILAQQDGTSQRVLQARLQVASVLTPDQRQKLLALNQQRRSKWQGRHQAPAGA